MANDLIKHPAGVLDLGVDMQAVDLAPDLSYDLSGTINVTSGLSKGAGPRYGMAPIPGHQSAANETVVPELPGLRGNEEVTVPVGFTSRRGFYHLYTLRLGAFVGFFDPIVDKITAYLWLVSKLSITTLRLFPSFSSRIPSGYDYTADFRDGLHRDTSDDLIASGDESELAVELVPFQWDQSGAMSKVLALDAYTTITTYSGEPIPKPYISSAQLTVSGQDIATEWMLGQPSQNATAANAPDIAFWSIGTMTLFATRILPGLTTDFQYKNYRKQRRSIRVYTLHIDGSNRNAGVQTQEYTVNYDPTDVIYQTTFNYILTPNLVLSGLAAGTSRDAGTAAGEGGALVKDPAAKISSAYQAVFAAPRRAYCTVYQEWIRSHNGLIPQFIDLVNNPCYPIDRDTLGVISSRYTENGDRIKTAFQRWPDYITDFPMVANDVVSFGPANSGVLRENRPYEFTYSLYNKRLGFESNVGTPVKFHTPAVGDNRAIILWRMIVGTDSTIAASLVTGRAILPFIFTENPSAFYAGDKLWLNYIEYRFYYRELGSFEWLPALFIDAAKYWFYPHFSLEIDQDTITNGLRACVSNISQLPGGQPTAVFDYSRLPEDQYDHVLTFQDRVWWFSEKSIMASLRQNIFAYPLRNSISIPTGTIKGGLVHNFPGQSEQTSRLLIYGTKDIYRGRFTGIRDTRQILVSSDNQFKDFPVDFSDFQIEHWTSDTAFSWRSAIIADGLHFYWGPNGIFRDDGVNTPVKISALLEPDLFKVYDPSKIDEIHTHYNSRTNEITWFYKPRVLGNATLQDEYQTHAIILNTRTKRFYPARFQGKIDQAFNVTLMSDAPTAGSRGIVSERANDQSITQRGYFYDERNRSGDLRPATEFLVQEISTLAGLAKRLALDEGGDDSIASVSVGDKIAIHQLTQYAPAVLGGIPVQDIIARVMAVNSTVPPFHLDVLIPDGVVFPAATGLLAVSLRFPIWHALRQPSIIDFDGLGVNGIAWKILTRYWAPTGPNDFYHWLWIYIMHKLNLWPSAPGINQQYNLGYRTPQSDDILTDIVRYDDNSDGTWQLYHALNTGNLNAGGQALKMQLSGVQIGSELLLQYLEAHCNIEDGNPLKQFEG